MEKREGRGHQGLDELRQSFLLATGIVHRTQIIASRLTGEVHSRELLIDASTDDIGKYLLDPNLRIDIFLSQLFEAFQSGEHRHINLELADLKRPDFPNFLSPILSRFRRKMDRKKIVIEITERGSVYDVYNQNVSRNLTFLKRGGFSLYVDDYDIFGSLNNNVSRMVLARYKGIIAGVKIPHEQSWQLLDPNGWRKNGVLDSIPYGANIIVEGAGLFERRNNFPGRIRGIQDPLNR